MPSQVFEPITPDVQMELILEILDRSRKPLQENDILIQLRQITSFRGTTWSVGQCLQKLVEAGLVIRYSQLHPNTSYSFDYYQLALYYAPDYQI